MPSIFISHSHADHRLAKRLQEYFETLSDKKIAIERSSDIAAIPTGRPWKEWIDDNIVNCDLAIVMLTESSLRGKWVLWEAGAVAGIQYLRDQDDDSTTRHGRSRVLNFGVDSRDMGPFAGDQWKSGIEAGHVEQFAEEILTEFREELGAQTYANALRNLRERSADFVEGARTDLRHTPTGIDEALVQTWLERLSAALEAREYEWIAAARRWINVAFLGIDAADKATPIDFRLHLKLSEAFASMEGERRTALQQLELAKALSPNDMVVLRQIGRLIDPKQDRAGLDRVLSEMEQLDSNVFRADREAIALKLRFFISIPDFDAARKLLEDADPGVVARDIYLLNWSALVTFKSEGLDVARPKFEALKATLGDAPDNFWDKATLTNALIALGDAPAAMESISRLRDAKETPQNNASAAKYFEELREAAGIAAQDLNWRPLLPLV